MAASAIAISSDSLEESMGTSTAQVILFSTIPTAIPTTIPVVDPPVIFTLLYISPFLYIDSSDSDTSERPPSQDPYEVTVARWRSQLIPIGRPYRTQPNGVRKMLTARKRVRAPPVGRLKSRYPPDHSSSNYFLSDDSSSNSPSDSLSGYSSNTSLGHSIPDSPFDTSAAISTEPYRKRFRSFTTSAPIATPVSRALSLVHADLLLPRKRIRGSISVTDFEVSLEESYEPYVEPDINSDVQADIDVGIATADAAAARETDVRVEVGIEAEAEAGEEANAEIQPKGTIEIRVDVATEIYVPNDLLTPDVVERLRQLEEDHGFVGYPFDYRVTLGFGSIADVKPEIGGNVNFEIKSQFMRELREDTFSENKNEDTHDHVDRVLNIVSLFNIPGVSQDAVLLRVFPFTLTGSTKIWVDRLTPGAVNTWDLLKKAFIQRYCPPSKIAKRLEDIHNFKQESDETRYPA
ncbi:MAK10-like protein [Tanacetum coccineum]